MSKCPASQPPRSVPNNVRFGQRGKQFTHSAATERRDKGHLLRKPARKTPLTTRHAQNDTRQKRREQTEGGHYRPLSSHALCHIRNCSHRVNPARSTARLNGVKKDTKKRKHRAIKALHRNPRINAWSAQQQQQKALVIKWPERPERQEGNTRSPGATMLTHYPAKRPGAHPRGRGPHLQRLGTNACGSGRRGRSAHAALPELKNTHSVPRGKRRRRKKTQGL